MSFFSTKVWSKIPTDLLENKGMLRVEKYLAPELRAAPTLLYLAGSMKADEDGIFDIGDGEEFADLIKVKTSQDVFTTAQVLTRFRILAHVPDSTVYFFTEWEYSTRVQNCSLQNRFAKAKALWDQKLKESNFFESTGAQIAATPVKCLNTTQPIQTLSQNTIQGAENGVLQIRREEIRQDKTENRLNNNRQEEITHREREEGVGEEREEQPDGCESNFDSTPSGFEKSSEQNQTSSEHQEILDSIPSHEGWSIIPDSEVASEAESKVEEKKDANFVPAEIIKILGDFFRANNATYDAEKADRLNERIADELYRGCGKDSAKAVFYTQKYCDEFKKMHDAPAPDRWHNVPLLPLYMIKDAIWAQLTERVSRIYGVNGGEAEKISSAEAQQKEWEEHLKDLEDPGKTFDADYIRNGIDPKDPARHVKLMIKLSAAGGENGGDIF